MKTFLFAIIVSALISTGAKAAPLSASNVFFSYSVTNLTTSTYIELFHSLTKSIKAISVYNTGTNPVSIAVGAAGSEVVQISVPPVGTTSAPVNFPFVVSQGQRISVKGSTGTNSSGSLSVNVFYN